MFRSIIEGFLDLDPKNKEKCIDLVNNFLFPIKSYLIIIVILIFVLVCSNLYLILSRNN
jgi:hypothetical protein